MQFDNISKEPAVSVFRTEVSLSSRLLQNFATHLQNYTVLHPTIPNSWQFFIQKTAFLDQDLKITTEKNILNILSCLTSTALFVSIDHHKRFKSKKLLPLIHEYSQISNVMTFNSYCIQKQIHFYWLQAENKYYGTKYRTE